MHLFRFCRAILAMVFPPQRYAWIDAAKGMAIVLVVFGHTWRGCRDAGLFAGAPAGLFEAVDACIYAFHMPLFFLISGLFLVPSLSHRGPVAFLKSRLARLLYPMALWTYLFAGSKILVGQLANDPLPASDFPLLPIPGQWQFWFLWALFLLHLGLCLLRPLLLSERFGRVTLWALLGASLAVQAVPLPPALLYWTSNAPAFLPYLVIGMLLGGGGRLRPPDQKTALALIVLFLVTLALVPSLEAAGIPRVVVAVLLCLSALGSVAWLSGTLPALGQGLAGLGAASMIIFLSHTFFSAGFRIALLSLGQTSLPLHLAAGTVVGLTLPLLLGWAAKRSGRPALFGV